MRVLTIFLMALLFISCSKDEEQKEAIRPVFYQKLAASGLSGQRSFAGITQAENEAKLSFKVGGTLEKIHFKLGEPIKKSSVLAHLNSDDYKINYQKALSSKNNAEIQLSSAKSSFDRIEKLYASNNASLSEYEKVKAQYESAKIMLKTAQSQLKAAKNQLDYTKLLAPFEGSISKIMAKEQEMIGAGMPVLMFLSNGNVEIRSQVPENIIQQVDVGQNVTVTFTAIPGKSYQGVISEIGRSTGGASTYPLIIDMAETYKEVLPGMACTINMTFSQDENAAKHIIVPPDAVAHDEGGDFVYVIESSSEDKIYVASRRNVTLGELSSSGYEIIEGLKSDEMIITAGLSFMYDGRKVRLLEK